MAGYRLFFLNRKGGVEAREEFEAADDNVALAVANFMGGACSDVCAGYELWQAARLVIRVDTADPEKPGVSIETLPAAARDTVLKVEDSLRRSRWRIAQSAKLMQEVERLRKL